MAATYITPSYNWCFATHHGLGLCTRVGRAFNARWEGSRLRERTRVVVHMLCGLVTYVLVGREDFQRATQTSWLGYSHATNSPSRGVLEGRRPAGMRPMRGCRRAQQQPRLDHATGVVPPTVRNPPPLAMGWVPQAAAARDSMKTDGAVPQCGDRRPKGDPIGYTHNAGAALPLKSSRSSEHSHGARPAEPRHRRGPACSAWGIHGPENP